MPNQRLPETGSIRPRSDLRDGRDDFLVVGVGASAGGLEACRKLISALPEHAGMALIVVQHLDPTHESLMADLLRTHTAMAVTQAADGIVIAPDHLYVIPPGVYLSVVEGALRISQPNRRHGSRLPFDHLLNSLGPAFGPRSVCVVLSGTGADGSLGLAAVKAAGGLVLVQDPAEASYDGMPRSAIRTGSVDLVAPANGIAEALVRRTAGVSPTLPATEPTSAVNARQAIDAIVDLLRARTAHDFSHYKTGTLERRIDRRMGLIGLPAGATSGYLDRLKSDGEELDALAQDILINVTGFFRDTKVFDLLAEKVLPDIVQQRVAAQPIRVWVVGCSTGEEPYSLAMLLMEALERHGGAGTIQIFASDVDAEAVAVAREGYYTASACTAVSVARLDRFFTPEGAGYRVSPDLRAMVIFTVQDILIDPPLSRMDLVSCRNLLIYLRPEAQAKVIARFRFALRPGGMLLLGASETTGGDETGFEVAFKSERIYRRTTVGYRPEPSTLRAGGEGVRLLSRRDAGPSGTRQADLAELCQRLILEAYAPAAVLINRRGEHLYSVGPTDRFLRVPAGQSNNDILAMAREGVREKLALALQVAAANVASGIDAPVGPTPEPGDTDVTITVRSVPYQGELLSLVCFAEAVRRPTTDGTAGPSDSRQVNELERELEATRGDLRIAVRGLEVSVEEQNLINEEARAVTEEFQATNEELLASKEELQSMNEELTALNGQLQETLERNRETSNDLKNVLYSTRVATIFLDKALNIRMFTPASRAVFNVIDGDVGRPLADLNPLALDDTLLDDARVVLASGEAREREVEAAGDGWYKRRIVPYRTQEDRIEGVVITFVDISESRQAAAALRLARAAADNANAAKSRFLAAASHDLRQPLQTLSLVHGLLAKTVEGDRNKRLVARLDDTLGSMADMLNALLDINQLEAGNVSPEPIRFPIANLLDRLKDEFAYHAQAQNLGFRVVPSGLWVTSDPRLLEQMLRNLIANALKYTRKGKVLIGCRRRAGALRIEVWDTGIGIPHGELQSIFDEFHQLENAARERSLGLGLGLSIVRSLGALLRHDIQVRSVLGHGSMFAIEVALDDRGQAPNSVIEELKPIDARPGTDRRKGTILVVEDDPALRELLEFALRHEGHTVTTAPDGVSALDLVDRGLSAPDMIIADYNLPNGMNGLQVMTQVRARLGKAAPVIILTGDISSEALRDIAKEHCAQLNKPTKLQDLSALIQRLLPVPPAEPVQTQTATHDDDGVIYIVDDDPGVRDMLREVLEDDGRVVESFGDCEAFLAAWRPAVGGCLLIDAYLPGMNGLDLLRRLQAEGRALPALMITGRSDVPMAVEAMKAGATDFLEKPVSREDLLAGIERALAGARDSTRVTAAREAAVARLSGLTDRQRQIMTMVLSGAPSKNIAADLGISQRTVENHRAAIMKRTEAKSLPALARLALAAAAIEAVDPSAPPADPHGPEAE